MPRRCPSPSSRSGRGRRSPAPGRRGPSSSRSWRGPRSESGPRMWRRWWRRICMRSMCARPRGPAMPPRWRGPSSRPSRRSPGRRCPCSGLLPGLGCCGPCPGPCPWPGARRCSRGRSPSSRPSIRSSRASRSLSRTSGGASRSLSRISSRRCSPRGGGASRRIGRSDSWAPAKEARRLSTNIKRFTGQSSGARGTGNALCGANPTASAPAGRERGRNRPWHEPSTAPGSSSYLLEEASADRSSFFLCWSNQVRT